MDHQFIIPADKYNCQYCDLFFFTKTSLVKHEHLEHYNQECSCLKCKFCKTFHATDLLYKIHCETVKHRINLDRYEKLNNLQQSMIDTGSAWLKLPKADRYLAYLEKIDLPSPAEPSERTDVKAINHSPRSYLRSTGSQIEQTSKEFLGSTRCYSR